MTRARGRPKQDSGLSHEAIRAAALASIDRDGLAELSIRKLGRELGCEAMALYWYYPSKDALLDAVVDELIAPVAAAVATPADSWLALLRAVAHAYRGVARAHPNAFLLLASRRFASEGTFQFLDRLFEIARAHGISDRDAARAYRIVGSYVSGFALSELAEPREAADLRARYPRVAAVTDLLAPKKLEAIFEHGLEVLLVDLTSSARA